MPRQVEIDIKITEDISAEEAIERRWEDLRHRHRRHKHSTPWDCHTSSGEGAQFRFITCDAARNAVNLPLKFDRRALRPDPLGDLGGQNRPFGSGIQDYRNGISVRGQSYDRSAVQGSDDNLSDRFCAAAGFLRYFNQVSSIRCPEFKARWRIIGAAGDRRKSGEDRPCD